MDAPSFADMTVAGFLDATAAKVPTPGGGAVAAVDVPMAVATLALDLLREYARLVSMTNRHLRSDLAMAAVLAAATARSAWWNVVVNVPGLPEGDRAGVLATVEAMVAKAEDVARDVERGCREPMP